jgi:2-methylaconitate cis-trans-isomerase PrpF
MASKLDFGPRPGNPFAAANDEPIRCVVMRGGTSRGLFFHENDLPADPALRDLAVMGAVGAPDPRHVDGLGGGDMLLSKVAIVARSQRADADVECEFANITPGKDRPTYGTNCGNLVGAVALFAVEEGLVATAGDNAAVRVLNRNSDSVIHVNFAEVDADSRTAFRLAGMPETGTRVDLAFMEPVGAFQGELMPTGNARDAVQLDNGQSVDISVVDAGALYVFVRGADLGLNATESADMLGRKPGIFDQLEYLRAAAARRIGIIDDMADAAQVSPDVPKLAIVGPPVTYHCDASSTRIESDLIDLAGRIISSQKYHKAYAVTGAIATAAAASIVGSVVHEAVGRTSTENRFEVRIGHPSGVLACEVETRSVAGQHDIASATIMRTARRVSEGTVFVPTLS